MIYLGYAIQGLGMLFLIGAMRDAWKDYGFARQARALSTTSRLNVED